jgi:hypothetical protein
MQSSDVGVISTVEIVPWMENPEFQNELKLDSQGDRIQFEKKRNLEANSELIAEIDRIDSAFTSLYYQGLNCLRTLEEKFPIRDDEYGFDPEKTLLLDLTEPTNRAKEAKLSTLLNWISKKTIDDIYDENTNFLYGDKKAIECVKEMEKRGIDSVHFREIDACKKVRDQTIPIRPLFQHYCLPELARVLP